MRGKNKTTTMPLKKRNMYQHKASYAIIDETNEKLGITKKPLQAT